MIWNALIIGLLVCQILVMYQIGELFKCIDTLREWSLLNSDAIKALIEANLTGEQITEDTIIGEVKSMR